MYERVSNALTYKARSTKRDISFSIATKSMESLYTHVNTHYPHIIIMI